jgi:flagellar biosynthesis/type III secretory pathway chaperone
MVSTASSLMQELELIEQDLEHNKRSSNVPRGGKGPLQLSKSFTEKLNIIQIPVRVCHACQEPIAKNGSVLNGKFYHNEHFVCNKCKISLKNILCYEVDDKLWCERDYHKKYSPECHYCHEPIKSVTEIKIGWY